MMKQVLKSMYRSLPFKPYVFAVLRKLPVPEAVFKHLHFEGPFTVWIDASWSFRMNHDGTSVQNELFWQGLSSYESQSIKLWSHLAARASIIVDGGAHNGLFGLIAGAINPSATIVAFEPEPRTFDKLVGNCELNSFS